MRILGAEEGRARSPAATAMSERLMRYQVACQRTVAVELLALAVGWLLPKRVVHSYCTICRVGMAVVETLSALRRGILSSAEEQSW